LAKNGAARKALVGQAVNPVDHCAGHAARAAAIACGKAQASFLLFFVSFSWWDLSAIGL
jgi:hypothetical protein